MVNMSQVLALQKPTFVFSVSSVVWSKNIGNPLICASVDMSTYDVGTFTYSTAWVQACKLKGHQNILCKIKTRWLFWLHVNELKPTSRYRGYNSSPLVDLVQNVLLYNIYVVFVFISC